MVKIPGTEEGLAPIEQMIAEGRSINVTLDLQPRPLREGDGGLPRRAWSGSLPIPTPTCRRSRAWRASSSAGSTPRSTGASTPSASEEALALRGKAAVAQAKLAYQLFVEAFSGPRWEALAARGARVQRPLWASTSTKNPAYPDTLYVDELIGPHTVNTLPDNTLEAFADHGTLARTRRRRRRRGPGGLGCTRRVGVDMDDVAAQLEREGVSSFQKSFDELLAALETKSDTL